MIQTPQTKKSADRPRFWELQEDAEMSANSDAPGLSSDILASSR
jgi:hypothetical protein